VADNVTGADLIAKCRLYGEIDDDYWTDANVLTSINDATKELWDRILAAPGGKAFLLEVSSDLAVTSGTATVSLPSDCGVEVDQVEVKYDDGYRPLRAFNMSERSDETVVTQSDKLGTQYRIVGSTILLSPTPTWSGYLRIWYVKVPTTITSGTSHNYFFGWDRFVWNKVCCMHARSRGEMVEADRFLGDAMLALEGILSRAASARTKQANYIRDVYAEEYRNRYPWGRRA